MIPVQVEERFYRHVMGSPDLAAFLVREGESDLWVAVDRSSWTDDLPQRAERALHLARSEIEGYAGRDPAFLTSLVPLTLPAHAPPLVCEMARAAACAGVGPMAAVAGAVAERVGRALLGSVREVIVENGGDIFICTYRPRRVAILAGTSPFSLRTGLLVSGDARPVAVCTSAGRWGHSLSLGQADAAVAVAPSGALADAAATCLGNLVGGEDDLTAALERARQIPGLAGAVLIRDTRLAAWGNIQLTSL